MPASLDRKLVAAAKRLGAASCFDRSGSSDSAPPFGYARVVVPARVGACVRGARTGHAAASKSPENFSAHPPVSGAAKNGFLRAAFSGRGRAARSAFHCHGATRRPGGVRAVPRDVRRLRGAARPLSSSFPPSRLIRSSWTLHRTHRDERPRDSKRLTRALRGLPGVPFEENAHSIFSKAAPHTRSRLVSPNVASRVRGGARFDGARRSASGVVERLFVRRGQCVVEQRRKLDKLRRNHAASGRHRHHHHQQQRDA